jgi:hypothetical protein
MSLQNWWQIALDACLCYGYNPYHNLTTNQTEKKQDDETRQRFTHKENNRNQ